VIKFKTENSSSRCSHWLSIERTNTHATWHVQCDATRRKFDDSSQYAESCGIRATLPGVKMIWSPVRVRFPRVHWETGARLAAARGCPRTFTEPHRARCLSPSLRVSTRRERNNFSSNNINTGDDGGENSRCIILSNVPAVSKNARQPNVAPPNLQARATAVNRGWRSHRSARMFDRKTTVRPPGKNRRRSSERGVTRTNWVRVVSDDKSRVTARMAAFENSNSPRRVPPLQPTGPST